MSLLKPDHIIRRAVASWFVLVIWLLAMWILWWIETPFELDPEWGILDRPRTAHGLFGPVCYSWDHAWFGHIHVSRFLATILISVIFSLPLMWLHRELVNNGIRPLRIWRQQRRSHRGLCIQCGYILKDLQRCPECGHERQQP